MTTSQSTGNTTPAEPKSPDLSALRELSGRLRAMRDRFLIATPDKTDTPWAIITETLEALPFLLERAEAGERAESELWDLRKLATDLNREGASIAAERDALAGEVERWQEIGAKGFLAATELARIHTIVTTEGDWRDCVTGASGEEAREVAKLRRRADAAEARADALAEAVKPFAALFDQKPGAFSADDRLDSHSAWPLLNSFNCPDITYGDVRRARQALGGRDER